MEGCDAYFVVAPASGDVVFFRREACAIYRVRLMGAGFKMHLLEGGSCVWRR